MAVRCLPIFFKEVIMARPKKKVEEKKPLIEMERPMVVKREEGWYEYIACLLELIVKKLYEEKEIEE